MPRCYIVDEMHPALMQGLDAAGIGYTYAPQAGRAEVLANIGAYAGIVVRSKLKLDSAFFAAATALRWVARAGAGTDNIDTVEAARRGITLLNAPEGNRDAVAEHCMGLLLALLNHIPQADAEVRQGLWQREANRGHELLGKTVGLIGYGNMGRAFARRLAAFGCRVLAYDKYLTDWPDGKAERSSLEEIWAVADILSLHVPLTEETRHMVNHDFYQRFVRPVWVINTSRGEVLPLQGLHLALQEGKVRGAALDVLEEEDFTRTTAHQNEVLKSLQESQKVIFSPHVAGWTVESYRRISEVLLEKILQLVQQG